MQKQNVDRKECRSSNRFLGDRQRKINNGFKNKLKTISSSLRHLKKEGDRINRNTVTYIGILQPPSFIRQSNYKFQLLTDEAILYLEAPKELVTLFERHTWERLIINGTLAASDVVKVKTARLETEEVHAIYDLSKHFDLTFYKRLIEHGFPLEPRLEEVI